MMGVTFVVTAANSPCFIYFSIVKMRDGDASYSCMVDLFVKDMINIKLSGFLI